MSDSLANVVIPYARFLECRERRRRIAAELTLLDPPPTIGAAVVPGPAETAVPQTLPNISTTAHDRSGLVRKIGPETANRRSQGGDCGSVL
jgi:hypothetical protein